MIEDKQPLSEQFDQFSTEKLLDLLSSSSGVDRAHALEALARRSKENESLIDYIIEGITDAKNISTTLMGTISVSHIGFAGLLMYGTLKAKEIVRQLLENWPEPDRSDLLWFLRSESISINDDS